MRNPGERIRDTLQKYKDYEITRAEALGEILRVLRTTCQDCKVRKELEEINRQDGRRKILENIEGDF